MKRYKNFISDYDQLDEGLLSGVVVERKLKSVLTDVKKTDDMGRKLDMVMSALHFSIGFIVLSLNKTKRGK